MKKIYLTVIISLFTLSIFPQTEEMVLPSDLKQLTIITEPTTLHKGFFRAGIVFSYGVVDKYFTDDNKKEFFPESTWASSWSSSFILQYGINDRLTAELFIPYNNEVWNYHQFYTSGELGLTQEENWDLQGSGLGDISLGARYQVLEGSQTKASLTASIDITLPTGEKNPTNIEDTYDYDLPTGYGAFVINPGILYRKISYPYSYKAYIRYTYNLPGEKIINPGDTEESEFTYGNRVDLGGSFDFHLNDWLAVTNELNYFLSGKGEREKVPDNELNTSWGLSYETRLVFQIRRIRLAEAVRLPLKGKSISADPLYVILLQYTF